MKCSGQVISGPKHVLAREDVGDEGKFYAFEVLISKTLRLSICKFP